MRKYYHLWAISVIILDVISAMTVPLWGVDVVSNISMC